MRFRDRNHSCADRPLAVRDLAGRLPLQRAGRVERLSLRDDAVGQQPAVLARPAGGPSVQHLAMSCTTRAVAFAGIMLFLATGLHQVLAAAPWPPDVYVVAFGVASATAILGACAYEQRFGFRPPRLFAVIGDASYSIYLVHLPMLSIAAKLLFASGLAARLPETVSLLMLLCAVVGGGIAFSRTIEMPLVAMLGKKRAHADIAARPSSVPD